MSEWSVSEVITAAKLNQKELFVGAAAPGTTYAGQLWFDTDDNVLKQRNAANNAWIERSDHGALGGLGDDDHSQYLNVARHDLVARHPVTVGGTGLATIALGGILYASVLDTLTRIAPTAAGQVLRSTGANALQIAALLVSDIPNLSTAKLTDVPAAAWATIFSTAFSIATVLSDHDKAAHDALNIDSDTLDTFHATSFPRLRDTQKNLQLTGIGETEICAYTIDGTDRIMRVATFFRVITGATVVTVTVKYTNILAQAVTCTLVDAKTLAVGDYTYAPLIFEIDASTEITLNITASVANRVFASGTIEELV